MTELNAMSETDASNTSISGASVAENCAMSGLNDAIRNLTGMAKRAYDRDHGGSWCTVGGTANAITLTYSVGPAAYVQGEKYTFLATAANTGATTVNVQALGAKNVFRRTGAGPAACVGGEIQNGDLVEVEYDGTQFQIISQASTAITKQMLSGESVNTISAGATGFLGIANITASETTAQIPVPFACTIRNLFIRAGAAPVGSETFTYTVRKNGADTALTCQITGVATTGNDTTHSVSFAAGDLLAVKAVASASATVTTHNWGLEINPT